MASLKYKATATHGAGVTAKDNLGAASSPVVAIAAGSKTKDTAAYTPFRNTFYGASASKPALDESGNMTDSGKKPADFVAAETGKRLMTNAEGEKLKGISAGATKTAASETNGHITIDGVDTTVYTEPSDVIHGTVASDSDVTAMLTEVFGA